VDEETEEEEVEEEWDGEEVGEKQKEGFGRRLLFVVPCRGI
jgi:hypothetical protein